MLVKIPVSVGEVVDKVTILQIKARRISRPDKLANIRSELDALLDVLAEAGVESASADVRELSEVNEALWDIEDKIRDKERVQAFDAEFIELARAVYRFNDRRFELKTRLNQLWGSQIVEEKSYAQYL